jgi:cytochrome d ubiquinol oxidase subunit II
LAIGLLALALFAFLAAVYLTLEADDDALREDFRLRAFAAAVFVFVTAFVAIMLARSAAPLVWMGLTQSNWALGYQLAIALAAIATLVALWTRRFRMARLAAGLQATLILWGWALVQYPWMLPNTLTIADAAAPEITLRWVLGALAVGFVILVPSLIYLFRVFKTHDEGRSKR